jgi:hypothetical protein
MDELKRSPDKIGRMQTIFTDRGGRVIGCNKKRLYERPFVLDTNPPNNQIAIPLPLQMSSVAEMRLAAEGPLQLVSLCAKKTQITTLGSGTITIAGGSTTVTGNGTQFSTQFEVGDTIKVSDTHLPPVVNYLNISAIASNTSLTITTPPANAVATAGYDIIKRFDMSTMRLSSPNGTDSGDLMNTWIHRDCITGSQGQPYPLPEGLYSDEGRAVLMTAQDISAENSYVNSGNGVQFSMMAAKYSQLQNDPTLSRVKQRMQAKQFMSLPGWYTFDQGVVTLDALSYQEAVISISDQHNFEIHQLSYAFGPSVNGAVSVNIVDLAKGESIINAPRGSNYMIPHTLLFGQNGYPYRYPEPITVMAGQKLLVQVQETAGNASTPFYLALGGKQVAVRLWS